MLSRRSVLTSAVAGLAGAGIGAAAEVRAHDAAVTGFYGTHQSGIATAPLPYLSLAGFDVMARDRAEFAALLRIWTTVAATLTASTPRLTLTFGFGPSLLHNAHLALADRRPDALAPLPTFPGESLDPRASDGDLCVQACAGNPTDAHLAVRTLLNAVRPSVSLRWRQNGFRAEDATNDPRGMFGFRDGTRNATGQVWVDDGPTWMRAGSYLVVRRIRLLLDTWDRTGIADQEAIIGRRHDTNERIEGLPGAHTALAAPESNDGATLLRRSYSYDAGVDPNGLQDSGLIFMCYQRDPVRQFVAIQRRLAGSDPLNGFSQHVASALFACPPGCSKDSWIGEGLLS